MVQSFIAMVFMAAQMFLGSSVKVSVGSGDFEEAARFQGNTDDGTD